LQEIANQTVASSADQVRAQVEQSAQTSADKTLQAWQAKLQEVADHAAASSEDQVQRKISEALILLGPKLQDVQERAVNDAVAAFRGRLSQLLGLLPAGGSK
jgi:vacuolar-type H+-ATPase subunit E/Vma4